MDMLRQLNAAIDYLEANLDAAPDLDRAAGIACVTADTFARFFSYMTGMTPTEYVRRRRLSLAAQELRQSETPIVDLAVKYGYDSAAAFSRAFGRQHGVAPSVFRKSGGSLRLYPPVSFHITVKGAKEMDFRMIELENTPVCGVSMPYEGQGYASREELRHRMWSERCEDIPRLLCGDGWNQPGSTACDGVWYGVWQNGGYMIARDPSAVRGGGLETRTLPAGAWAAFKTKPGGLAWEELPRLFELIFDCWLPSSGYRQREELVVEVLHLWTDRALRRKKRYYELWVPVAPR